jgi:uncharacterized protein YggE
MRTMAAAAPAAKADVATPLEPGSLDVSANLTLTVEVAPR